MKRAFAVLLIAVLLAGCGSDSALDRAMALRERLLQSDGCVFDAVVTADYTQKVYTFTMKCQADQLGNLSFAVTDPETICGITGTVSHEGGKLTFDDQVLAFEMLADGQVTPVSAPWLLVQTMRSGYIKSCTQDDGQMRITIDDSYADDALQLDIWINEENVPVRAEILWQGRRILTLAVRNFTYV